MSYLELGSKVVYEIIPTKKEHKKSPQYFCKILLSVMVGSHDLILFYHYYLWWISKRNTSFTV